MNGNKDENVIQFPGKYAIFSPHLRQDLERGVASFSEQPKETISTVENVICTTIVAHVRGFFSNIASKAGESLAKRIAG